MKKLTLQEIKDTLVGCTILGTGGGGSLESGLEAVEKAWNAGHEFKLLSFDEINDDSYYANPYYCGSIVPKGDTSQKRGDEIATSVKAETPAQSWPPQLVRANTLSMQMQLAAQCRSFSFPLIM